MTLELCDAVVDSLLGAVRRRLWCRRLLEAARLATWASVAIMLLAVAVIYFVKPAERVEAVLLALGVIWALALGWVLLRRPSTDACALWADQHLGGASAYSTLLDIRSRGVPEPSPAAADYLARWLTANVPEARRRLRAERDRAHLARPMLLMIVSAALLVAVLTLPGVAPELHVTPAARPPQSSGSDMAAPQALARESAGLVNELEAALNKGRSRPAGVAGASGDSDNPRDMVSNEPVGAGADRAQARKATGTSENAIQESARKGVADAAAESGFAAASASGHEAGEARDDGSDRVSRSPSGAISVKDREVKSRTATVARQADMTQPAAFEDEHAVHAGTRTMSPPIGSAALPPAAENTIPLTPTQAAYVQAWLKMQGSR
jgi:hypothetical protein